MKLLSLGLTQKKVEMEKQVLPTNTWLAAQSEIEFLRQQVELYQEVSESQNVYLHCKEQELQELQKELKVTNRDLCIALMSANISFEEAKVLATKILESDKITCESLAELLSVIYDEKVQPEELQHVDLLTATLPLKKDLMNPIIDKSKEVRAKIKEFKKQCQELSYQSVSYRERLKEIKEKWNNFFDAPPLGGASKN